MQVTCRAQVAEDCEHGKELADSQYRVFSTTPTDEESMEEGMRMDGTYDGESVICKSCYIRIGMPPLPVGQGRAVAVEYMNKALDQYRQHQREHNPPPEAA